ncbi:MAG: hypothetical protein P1P84_17760 [Deferrisomatales bacterium]|nr:hypothetical protein [Deferrisomatales bacterium]
MNPTMTRFSPLLISLLTVLLAAPVGAAVTVTKPKAGASGPPAKPPPQLLLDDDGGTAAPAAEAIPGVVALPLQAGQVIFARGDQVVAEIEGGAVDGEYLVVFDSGFRRKGAAVVVQALKGNTYLLRGAGTSLSEGDRLGRETELQAAARVLRQNNADGFRAFLTLFPDSTYRERIARELFRLQMQAQYPARPGHSVGGSLLLVETVNQPVPMEDVQVLLDRFVVVLTGAGGQYRIDGIPLPEVPVTVKLKVKDPKFRSGDGVSLDLPAGKAVEAEKDLPVLLTPTVLSGMVLDGRGEPLPGAEVWTSPYTLEFLTGDDGAFQISRRKDLDDPGAPDQPLFGGEFEVYARRAGFSVERVAVSAESFVTNPVPAIRLVPQDTRNEGVPELAVALRQHLRIDPSALAGAAGAGPLLNP